MLNAQMKRRIAAYIAHFSTKGFLEDIDIVGEAYNKGEITREEIEEFAQGIEELILEAVPEPNPGQMTEVARKNHLENAGQDGCPYCKADTSEHVEYGECDPVESGEIHQKAECKLCKRQWMDVFTLTDVHELASK